MVNYRIRIVTGSMKDAGTDAHVYLTAVGTNGIASWTNLNDPNDKDDFEKGDVNTITVSNGSDLGDIRSITIGHDNKNGHAGWFVSSVQITNLSTGKTWTFLTNRWLAKDEADRKLCASFTPSSVTQAADYKITIFTGEAEDSGTDAHVYLKAFGSNGSFSLYNINDPNDSHDFDAGRVNSVVYASSVDIGEISRITIGHDNSGKRAGWYLDGVKIQNLRTGKVWSFPVYRWLAKDEDDRQIERTVSVGKDMPHYEYICNYPSDREPGWSEELNGVSHDDDFWYFTQKKVIWKFPVTHDLNNSCKNENVSARIYRCHYGQSCNCTKDYHLGDIECFNGYLFIPIASDGDPYIAVFATSNIKERVAMQRMRDANSNAFSNIGWCAINPQDGLLYTSSGGLNKNSPILVYSINWNAIKERRSNFLTLYTKIFIVDEESDDFITRDWMQGGCFDKEGHLFLTNGAPTNGPTKFDLGDRNVTGTYNHANKKGGITVYEIPRLSYNPNGFTRVKVLARSNQSHNFRFQFNGYRNEPEGITYWNLDGKGVPGISGQLHVIMLDNNGSGDDDLYFKHFRKI